MANAAAGDELSLMATVNGVIDELHGSLGLADSDFFCECGHIGCRERITLTRAEYASLRRDDRPVLVADHVQHGMTVVGPRHEHRVARKGSTVKR